MTLFLTEREVESLLTVPEAITALERTFLSQARGDAVNQSRQRIYMPAGTYHTMAAADLDQQVYGLKVYSSFQPRTRFLFHLHDAGTGDLLALMEADHLGRVRTGAASGLATAHLARNDAPLQVGIYGAGWQAQPQLEAVCAVRDVARITVYSRDEVKRSAFCDDMSARLNREVVPAERPEDAAEQKHIVITATSARDPVLKGEWLAPGAHINAVGSNMLVKREVDEKVVTRADLVVVDSLEQARLEAGDLLPAIERRLFRWEQARSLHEIVSGPHPGRTDPAQITLFKSIGIALEDVSVAALVYKKALERKVGTYLPLWAN